MVAVTFIEPSGDEKVVDASPGSTLMRAAVDNDVNGILGDCGGACSCGTCHCYIDEKYLDLVGTPDVIESSILETAVDPQTNSRLGCQVTVTDELDGLVVRLPVSQY